jgi:hypothetical protein
VRVRRRIRMRERERKEEGRLQNEECRMQIDE